MNEDGVARDGGFRMIAWISGGKNLSSSLIALRSVLGELSVLTPPSCMICWGIECSVCERGG